MNKPTIPVFQQLTLLAVLLLLIFGVGYSTDKKKDSPEKKALTVPAEVVEIDTLENAPEAFSLVNLTGTSAYVWDIQSQRVLYKKNAAEELPLASITKLMTALVAHEILEEDRTIVINQDAIKQDGSSGFVENEYFDRQSLNELALVSSSNDGAYALALAAGSALSEEDPANAFVQAMNIRAKEIGLSSTYFKNPTGLDISETEGGAYGTARDVAFLLEYIVENEPSILTSTNQNDLAIVNGAGYTHEVENTNYFVDEIPGLIGSKTGYTDLAGGNLAVVFDAAFNRPVVVVVLGSTRQERFSDVLALTKEVQTYLNQNL